MRRIPHIAYVCGDRGVPVGGSKGASAHVAELTRALAERGAKVHIVAARAKETINAHEVTAPVTDLGSQRINRRIRKTLFADTTNAKQKTQASEASGLLLNQQLGRTLDQLDKHWGIDAVYERYSLWSYAGAGFARQANIPFLLEVNAPLRDEQRKYRALENDAAAASLESYLFRTADRVLVPAEALRPYVVARGAASGAVRVVSNAADPTRFDPAVVRRRMRADKAEFVVGFLGSLKPWHGLDILTRVFRRLHNRYDGYRLLIVGDGPMRAELEAGFSKAGLSDAVTFAGETDYGRIPDLLASMDVAVAPYPRMPGFYFSPIKLFEYMAAGVPVVASEIGQIAEFLTHRKTALLHKPGAVLETVSCIEQVRKRPVLAAELSRAARGLIGRKFTWYRNADRILRMVATLRRTRGR